MNRKPILDDTRVFVNASMSVTEAPRERFKFDDLVPGDLVCSPHGQVGLIIEREPAPARHGNTAVDGVITLTVWWVPFNMICKVYPRASTFIDWYDWRVLSK